jgi:subtilisin family serine protease
VNRYKEGVGCALLFIIVVSFSLAQGQYLENGVNYASNRIVVAFTTHYSPLNPVLQDGIVVTGISEVDALNRLYDVTMMWPLFPKAEEHGEPAMAGYYSLVFNQGQPLETILNAYAKLASVDHVEPVGVHRIYFTPNDPSLSLQWAITKIQARLAWDQTRGDSTVALGIADTGVDWDHPDLAANIWINTADPIDGIDNDGDGYIDDYRGWDWVTGVNGYPGEDDQTPDNNPMDFDGHGTHCSGIASAVTNNGVGIAGVGFNTSIMCLRIGWMGTDGNGYVGMDFAASAMYYAGLKGAKAINCSWGSSNSGGIAAGVTYATNHGVVVVSAAGNDNSNVAPYLCTRSDVIAVAATDINDHRASFSNFGSWVDVSAPGVNIYSTFFNNTYAYLDGTSMAAPQVVGIIGLIRSIDPSMTRAQAQARVISTTTNIDALNPGYAGLLGSGRVNAYNAVNGLGGSLGAPIPVSPINDIYVNIPRPRFTWIDTTAANSWELQVDLAANFASPVLDDSTILDTTFVPIADLPEGFLYWHVRASNGSIWSEYSTVGSFFLDSHPPTPPVLTFPSNNGWTNQRRPNFRWQASIDSGSGIYNYFIQVDNDSLFASPWLVNDSTSSISYQPNLDLPIDTRIFWRVRARDEAGNTGNYSTGSFGIDITAPGSPIGFNALPDGWTSNPNFTLSWSNPTDESGISRALYKIHSAPVSNFDSSGHFGAISPANYLALATDSLPIYVWLVDGAGNASYTQRAFDTLRYDGTPPSGCTASSPDTSSTYSFNVSWSPGTDIGSGLDGFYDVRYRDGTGGSWLDWQVHVSSLSASFTGVNGHTYYFEARTGDRVGNLEAFSGNPESQTSVDTAFVGPPFVPGDANGNGTVNGIDVVYLVNYLKGVGPPPPDPILRADANGSCTVNGIDVVYIVNYLKGVGPAPFAGNCK